MSKLSLSASTGKVRSNTKPADPNSPPRLAVFSTGLHNTPSKAAANSQFWHYARDTTVSSSSQRGRIASNPLKAAFKPSPARQPKGSIVHMTDPERQTLAELRDAVAALPMDWAQTLTDSILLRCLVARKWDVERALVLLESYATVLIPAINPQRLTFKDVAPMFNSGALIVPGGRDTNGAQLIMFRGDVYEANELLTPIHMVKLALYLVHNAMKSEVTLRSGFTVILTNLSGSQKELELRNVFVETFQNRYPARIHAVLIMASSWLEKILLSFKRPFIKQKLKAKIQICRDNRDLEEHVAQEQMVKEMEGSHPYDHDEEVAAKLGSASLTEDDLDLTKVPAATPREHMLMFTNKELAQARAAVAGCRAYAAGGDADRNKKAKKSGKRSRKQRERVRSEQATQAVQAAILSDQEDAAADLAAAEENAATPEAPPNADDAPATKAPEVPSTPIVRYPPVKETAKSVEVAAPGTLKNINRMRRARGLPNLDGSSPAANAAKDKVFVFGSSIKREELTPDKLDDEAAAAAAPKGAWDGVPLASVVRKLHTTLEDSGDEGSVATSSYSESYPNSTYALVTLPNDGYSHSELMDNKTPKKMIRKRSKKRVKTKTWVKPPSPARNVRTEVL